MCSVLINFQYDHQCGDFLPLEGGTRCPIIKSDYLVSRNQLLDFFGGARKSTNFLPIPVVELVSEYI